MVGGCCLRTATECGIHVKCTRHRYRSTYQSVLRYLHDCSRRLLNSATEIDHGPAAGHPVHANAHLDWLEDEAIGILREVSSAA